MGARRLIVHFGDYAPLRREDVRHRVAQAKDLRKVAAFGQVVVYELGNPGTR